MIPILIFLRNGITAKPLDCIYHSFPNTFLYYKISSKLLRL